MKSATLTVKETFTLLTPVFFGQFHCLTMGFCFGVFVVHLQYGCQRLCSLCLSTISPVLVSQVQQLSRRTLRY